jgi:hypothetical protein
MKRFEKIGLQIMNRGQAGGMMEANPIGGVLGDPDKRRAAAQLLGQAYVTAFHLVRKNKDKVEQIAEVLIERRELHGDEVVELLERARLREPEIDLLDQEAWPKV